MIHIEIKTQNFKKKEEEEQKRKKMRLYLNNLRVEVGIEIIR